MERPSRGKFNFDPADQEGRPLSSFVRSFLHFLNPPNKKGQDGARIVGEISLRLTSRISDERDNILIPSQFVFTPRSTKVSRPSRAISISPIQESIHLPLSFLPFLPSLLVCLLGFLVPFPVASTSKHGQSDQH